MTLTDRIRTALTTAMREQDALRRDTLRMAVAALDGAAKDKRRALSDDDALAILVREVKTRRESVEAYRAAGRPELAAKEESEIAILQGFLPQPLSEDELRDLVVSAIEEVGATSARDLGRVMGALSAPIRGRADGKVASGMVAQELARRDVAGHGH